MSILSQFNDSTLLQIPRIMCESPTKYDHSCNIYLETGFEQRFLTHLSILCIFEQATYLDVVANDDKTKS